VSRTLKGLALFFVVAIVYTVTHYAIDRHSPTTTTTTSSTTTSSTTTTTAATTSCSATDFAGRFNQGQGAAGTIYASVTITKSTPGTCTLRGWPRLTLLDAQGGLITTTTDDVPNATQSDVFLTPPQANHPPTTLTVADNGSATFALAYSDVSVGSSCPSAQTISVQLPGGSAEVAVTASPAVQACNGTLTVSPFYAGAGA
jgi:Domain of unknown function (DUF4232)